MSVRWVDRDWARYVGRAGLEPSRTRMGGHNLREALELVERRGYVDIVCVTWLCEPSAGDEIRADWAAKKR